MEATTFKPSEHYTGAVKPTSIVIPEAVMLRVKLLIAQAKAYGVDEIDADDNLILDLQLDDLDYVELVIACDHEFGIRTPERASFNVTVSDIAGDVAATLRTDARASVEAFRSAWGL